MTPMELLAIERRLEPGRDLFLSSYHNTVRDLVREVRRLGAEVVAAKQEAEAWCGSMVTIGVDRASLVASVDPAAVRETLARGEEAGRRKERAHVVEWLRLPRYADGDDHIQEAVRALADDLEESTGNSEAEVRETFERGEAHGRSAERAAIVEWLARCDPLEVERESAIAESIRRGEHIAQAGA